MCLFSRCKYLWVSIQSVSQFSCSVMSDSATLWIAARQASLSITNSWSLLKLTSMESVMPSAISSSVVPFSSCPQSLPASGSFPMSQLFAWGGQSIGVSASASVLPIEHPGLISFRMGWLDLLAVQGTLRGLLQHNSSKASILQRSAFFTVQLSHPYMTTGKTIALTRQTFVGKVMSLHFFFPTWRVYLFNSNTEDKVSEIWGDTVPLFLLQSIFTSFCPSQATTWCKKLDVCPRYTYTQPLREQFGGADEQDTCKSGTAGSHCSP